METIKYFVGGQYRESKTDKYYDVYNPSTGEITAKVPCCTKEEVEEVISVAKEAYQSWSKVPVLKRVQTLYNVRDLLIKHREELTLLVAQEHGKVWAEAEGDVLKAQEGTELACSVPSLMMGESLMNTSDGYDTTLNREPLGVFAGITPFNFPAMIPFGWMTPLCVATGNCIVLKASSSTPRTALRIAELYKEAGVPDGVVNVITCSREEAEIFLSHPDVKGISFVGSTDVGKHIYGVAASNGKRVQALCEAKNHALVMNDAAIERTAAGIINSAFGCAGERCMALPVVVAEDEIADALVSKLVELAKNLKVGPAYDKTSTLGPVVDNKHKERILKWIQKGIDEGATLILDGRNVTVEGYEKGFYLGPTIFDHVTEEMTIGTQEIFGPVLCIKRVKNFEEGLTIMNNNPFANGSVIFTQNGYFAREFVNRTDGGMVGVNVGIPVPVGVFPFSGHKNSFFGDLHCLGKDGVRFYTESKTVTTKWFDEEEKKSTKVSTWDGTI
ncbi:CoA-acylating methylmalonate-semialdehyde dehydrogenase [Anaerocolumna aminovalerica]|jgi:malonate-semialdehyde dehydrogenase (acetylating)/methylmalonate-semialdehyde dehydrogenase|uniref:Malonate-semialdehyde dehydrogenase (Acetylating) / methylmalonate-semialdehyde dehydrogenase n=1 Tax=Anaerocolumna aminovalerica TaxID=1527 RepID=A0A1I5GPL0_9FIRM|nr:CoA-acylating methylmalonate-semialdehyde dehydrogenase [Anaerocolumna aminovalerica]MDU6263210.1 CoA-acylating methylmalonate-semialdehyde dehydrogenase [Anaerocolumna aminovalerica]SFO37945.1 malonate-semialdehyde dehydrogenase (acetylating) / methylmalonate-semialdehyde dehydrogenase [Anaerocolumna aminovalerica]